MNDLNSICVFFEYKNAIYLKVFHVTKDQWEKANIWDVVTYYDAMHETDYCQYMKNKIVGIKVKLDCYKLGSVFKPADDNQFRAFVEGD